MSTATTTRIPEGQRVVYIGGGDEHNESLVGKQGVVKQDDGSNALPYYVQFDSGDYSWWCPFEALKPVPAVGDTVVAIRVPGRPQYDGKVAKVTEVQRDGLVLAEFQSIQKPDDSESFVFSEWRPMDGHTLTVSDPYRPNVGDRVRFTGCLEEDGIRDGFDHNGTVTAVTGDIWEIDGVHGGKYVSGPGYVFPVETQSEPVLPHEEPRIITELREEAATLKRELDRANERVEELSRRAGKWERDFNRYAERVMQEAIDRDWCSEYERVIGDIRDSLEIAEIPERDEEVDIEWEETYTVTVRRSATVTLKHGYDSDDIDEAARSQNSDCDADTSEIIQAVRDGNYSSEDYVDGSASTY